MSWMVDYVERRKAALELAAETARKISESGGSISFCDDPETVQTESGISQIRTIAVIEGRQTKKMFPFGEKQMRGSAVIFERTHSDSTRDIRIVPNDAGFSNIERFTIDDARAFFDRTVYQQVENAIHTNLANRKAHIKARH